MPFLVFWPHAGAWGAGVILLPCAQLLWCELYVMTDTTPLKKKLKKIVLSHPQALPRYRLTGIALGSSGCAAWLSSKTRRSKGSRAIDMKKSSSTPPPPPPPLTPALKPSSTVPLPDPGAAAAAQPTTVLIKAGEKIVIWKRDGQAEVKAGYALVTLGAGDTFDPLVNRIADGTHYLLVSKPSGIVQHVRGPANRWTLASGMVSFPAAKRPARPPSASCCNHMLPCAFLEESLAITAHRHGENKTYFAFSLLKPYLLTDGLINSHSLSTTQRIHRAAAVVVRLQ